MGKNKLKSLLTTFLLYLLYEHYSVYLETVNTLTYPYFSYLTFIVTSSGPYLFYFQNCSFSSSCLGQPSGCSLHLFSIHMLWRVQAAKTILTHVSKLVFCKSRVRRNLHFILPKAFSIMTRPLCIIM